MKAELALRTSFNGRGANRLRRHRPAHSACKPHVGEHNTGPPNSNRRIGHGQRHPLDNGPELDEARQGVTGHHVRKVLGWGVIATILSFAVVAVAV